MHIQEHNYKVHQIVLIARLWAAVSTFRGASLARKVNSLLHGLLFAPPGIGVPEYVLSIAYLFLFCHVKKAAHILTEGEKLLEAIT